MASSWEDGAKLREGFPDHWGGLRGQSRGRGNDRNLSNLFACRCEAGHRSGIETRDCPCVKDGNPRSLRLILRRMRQRPFELKHLPKIALINPAVAHEAFHEVVAFVSHRLVNATADVFAAVDFGLAGHGTITRWPFDLILVCNSCSQPPI